MYVFHHLVFIKYIAGVFSLFDLSFPIRLFPALCDSSLPPSGDYQPVEVAARADVASGGVYQLRQGQQRRLAIRVQPVTNSGTLPLVCDAVTAISIGSVTCRSERTGA